MEDELAKLKKRSELGEIRRESGIAMKSARPKKKTSKRTTKKAVGRIQKPKATPRNARAVSKLKRHKTGGQRILSPKKNAQPRAKVSAVAKPVKKSKIVRIMGHGQYTVNSSTLKRLGQIDDSIVQLVSNERSEDAEFKKYLAQLIEIVIKDGKALDPKEIIKSDIILPSSDLSVDEAKKLFVGEGVIPET